MTPIKSKSPFYPGQPVPVELFVGRVKEIDRIRRAMGQVAAGKPQAVFVTGEYGIGKSSLAGYIRFLGEHEYKLLGIHVLLGGATTLEEVATKTVQEVLKSGAFDPSWTEATRNALAKYIGKQDLFGITVNLEALETDAPTLSRGFLPFLESLFKRVEEKGTQGLLLILDEINGISSNAKFAHFIKSIVDENALARKPLPLLLMLCGVEERRRELIQKHQPVERIFDIAEISPMSEQEVRVFFDKAFRAEQLTVDDTAHYALYKYSSGFPKVMHILGDNAFWIDKDGRIDLDDAIDAAILGAQEVGRKFVDQQVIKALRSEDYRSILAKLGERDFDLAFHKSKIADGLTSTEKNKFNNFLQKMKRLQVLKSGDDVGEYVFNDRLVRLYLRLNSARISQPKSQ